MLEQDGLNKPRQFRGRLGIGDNEIAISFKAQLDETGSVVVDLEQIPFNNGSRFILTSWDRRDDGIVYFRLIGEASFHSEHLYFTSVGPHSNSERESYFAFTAHCRRVTFRRQSQHSWDKPMLSLGLRGLQCFPKVTTSCDLGDLVAAGDINGSDDDKMSGHLRIMAKDLPLNIRKWRTGAEKLLDR